MSEFGALSFVKICGITTLGDANAAIEVGADAIGLILAVSSRQVTLERALAIATATKHRTSRVLVFRDHDNEFILDALDLIDVDAVQLHGALDKPLRSELRRRELQIIKALGIASDEFYDFDESSVDAVMVDGATPGSGESHSWDALADRPFTVPVIAAGGLNEDNVASVIATTSVWGVDSASGVESSPGVKDRDRIEAFIANARVAFETRVRS